VVVGGGGVLVYTRVGRMAVGGGGGDGASGMLRQCRLQGKTMQRK
jgi:hypothetical protein